MALIGRISDKRVFGTLNEKRISGNIKLQDKEGKITYPYLINPYDSTVSPYCEEATALFTRMAVQPSVGLKELIDKTIIDLKDAGIWSITDKIHKWDLHNEQASLLDWKNAAHNSFVAAGTPLFTPKYGVQTKGLEEAVEENRSWIDLNLIPSTDCIYGSLNDMAFSLDDLVGTLILSFNFGAKNTSNNSYILFRTKESDAANRPWLYLNSALQRVYNNAGGIKLYYNVRPNATEIRVYQNATTYQLGTGNNSVGMVNQSLVLGGNREYNGAINRYGISTSTFWMGSQMTAEQIVSWYDIINYWKANIGSAF